ncbi:hypothetical protein V494_04450 [Pseudogymnoascus sp. VKM F-4513 (FW-928)]|nr:hypothetical protein V494_04450 [Pseudogymnoascus sp. VKM F-4513 (FW-928)]
MSSLDNVTSDLGGITQSSHPITSVSSINGSSPNGHNVKHDHNDTANLTASPNPGFGQEDERSMAIFEPVAIVGMALRLPGGIRSPEALWQALINKKSTRGLVPPDRYNIEAFYSPSQRVGSVGMQHGHFLSEGLEHIDTSFFTMSQAEIEKVDPQHRMLLEVVWECMESAGQKGWRGTNTGVFVGTWGEDWIGLAAKDSQRTGVYDIAGLGDFSMSNRISYEYNLHGPSMTVKTACSSSTTALHEACQAIQTGNCASAIVAGANLIMTPTMTTTQTEAGVLSPTGESRTFDASANGYARGEAINAIYIKKLSAAVRDGDPIRAVIRATGANCDGRSEGIMSPNPKAHESLMKGVYARAQLDSHETPFVECHGTGTAAGDPLELEAVGKVFGNEKVTYIGSVKPNFGHSEGASGITSIIKAIMALENQIIPPQVNFSTPNPKIPFVDANLKVPVDVTPWPKQRQERISVNSFGVTGANAHIILESARSYGISTKVQSRITYSTLPSPRLLVYSASNTESLRERAKTIGEYIQSNVCNMEDLAFTLANRREHLERRGYCITDGSTSPEMMSTGKAKNPPSIKFVFTGQGAQWPGMAIPLAKEFPSFDADIRECGEILAQLPNPPTWSVYDELAKLGHESLIGKAEYAQPLCTVVQIALVNLLKRFGVSPSAVVGHSSGEIAAAYAANAITAKEAIITAYYRGLVTTRCTKQGAMAAVGLGRAEASLYLERGVIVACENSQTSVTLSGDSDGIDSVIEQLRDENPDIFVRRLKTGGMAYHSHHMADIGPDYESLLQEIVGRNPSLPFFSTVTGKKTSAEELGPLYWRQNLESPVNFYSAVKGMIEDGDADQVFVEIGPHSSLAGPLRQIFKETMTKTKLSYTSTLVRGENCLMSFLKTLGELYIQSSKMNFELLTPNGRTLVDIPSYPWRHDKCYWDESRVSKGWRLRKFPHHEILGSRILDGNDLKPTWRNVLRLKDVPWISHHKVREDIVFPAAAYISMAVEAVRQLTGMEEFSIKNLDIHIALVLNDDQNSELMTSFSPKRLTATLDSEFWYEFCISSYNGSTWTRHCVGDIRPGKDCQAQHAQLPSRKLEPLPRHIQSPYSMLKRLGLNYGERFQGLDSVSAFPGRYTAYSTLRSPETSESHYALHPTTIDNCLQLFAFAASDGLLRKMDRLHIPTFIDQLYICDPKAQVSLTAEASTNNHPGNGGGLKGSATIMGDGQMLLSLQGGIFSAVDSDDIAEDTDTVAAARLHWDADIDFADSSKLMIPSSNEPKAIEDIEKFSILCMLDMQQQISNIELSIDHLVKYRQWINTQLGIARNGGHPLVQDDRVLTSMNSDERRALIATMTEQLRTSELSAAAELIYRLYYNCSDIFNGKREALEIYVHDNGLTNVYNITADRLDSTAFMKAVGHNNPSLKVLEIGAGTGGTSIVALQSLTCENGERMYSKYSYTDISSGFFPTAQKRFADYKAIEFKTLDISLDPLEQGFEANSYDLIIASNVIHATPELTTTLKHVQKLLHPNGRFFLQELVPSAPKFMHLIMGVLPGWWLGEADGRPHEPIVSAPRWEADLRESGFSGIETIVYDDPRENVHISANIIARPTPVPMHFRAVTLLCPVEECKHVDAVRASLEKDGFDVECCKITDVPRSSQDIISLLDLQKPFLDGISEETFEAFKTFIKNVGTAGILWVTKEMQINCKDPQYSQFLGLSRTIRSELSIPLATLEVDTFDTAAFTGITRVFNKFQARDVAAQIDPDWEFSLIDGEIYIGRYHWITVHDEIASVQGAGDHPLKLEIGQRGLLHSLRWVQAPIPVLGSDEVIVEPRCVGINFKDILATMGIADDEGAGIGLEGSGIIHDIGSNVKHLKIGDRVMVLDRNCFSTHKTCLAERCVKIPDSLSFADAATMPCVYGTVIYSLMKMAYLKAGQTILIHSACGGVGIAAIQLCKMIGAKVYATVGSSEKVQYLIKTFGLSRSEIFNSRDESFLPDLMCETQGRGVDVVLNSLSGELLHASWKCVAPRGKMIEIGRRDFIGRAQLSMDLFDDNRMFIGVNLASLPDLYPELLTKIVALYSEGHIQPISPLHLFDAENVEEAFRFMQKGQHIGKLVIAMPKACNQVSKAVLPTKLTKQPLRVRQDAAYILAGGLGGLGRAVATYLVECGARHLIFLSRSAGSSESDKLFLAELASQDCHADMVAGSVTNVTDVKQAVGNAIAAGRPVAGVLQLSMVLRDLPLMKMSHKDWRTAIEPKVDGTLNLHTVLLEYKQELDFFVMFSSALGNFGAAHQSNYAAGNTFQDAFVQYRHFLGLPASVLDVGVMADIGYVSQNISVENNMRATGMWFLNEKDLLDALHLSILTSQPSTSTNASKYTSMAQLGIGFRSTKTLSEPSNRVLWRRDKRMTVYRNMEDSTVFTNTTSGKHDELNTLMAGVEADPALLSTSEIVHALTREIGITVYRFMLQPVEELAVEKALSALGVDSLVTIELRNWLRRRLGIEVTTLEMLSTGGGTIASLGQIAVERLKSKLSVSAENGLDACAIEKLGNIVTV